jgi:LPS export ABC transporter protein LptC
VLLAACADPAPVAARDAGEAPSPERVLLEGVVIERWTGGRLSHQGEASRARVDRGRGTVEAFEVRGEARAADGAVRAEIRAGRATGAVGGDRLELDEGVTLRDRSGRRVDTASASLELSSERVSAPGAVRLSGANFRADGRGLDARLAEDRIELGGPVRARVSPEPAGAR